jgi:16S rRNA (adenine1518-N6/adenine1519-N6)-dimethyltransferase
MKQGGRSIEAKKSLGQHFLNNERIPAKMADAANVLKGDVVLEIGPGTGVLTSELLARGAQVLAIEADVRAIASLKEAFAAEIQEKRLTILHMDVREMDLGKLGLRPHGYKVVANIPYYLSGMLFRTFLEHENQPSCLVFLVQREVAERIAKDKKESILSLSVKVFGDPRYVETVKRGNFNPPPKVDSAIISVSNISKERLGTIPQKFFFSLVHEGFKSRRKQLFGNLGTLRKKDELTHIFSTLDLPLSVRGEDVSLDNWLHLAHKFFSTDNTEKSSS